MSLRSALTACAGAVVVGLAWAGAAQADHAVFAPGTYGLEATSASGPPFPSSEHSTMVVSDQGGGLFEFSITGDQNVTFELNEASFATELGQGGLSYPAAEVTYLSGAPSSDDAYVLLYPLRDGGGLTIGTNQLDDLGPDFIDDFGDPPGAFYTAVPEPPVWALGLIGFAIGAVFRGRRALAAR
jgi:hypothetical protein